MAFENLNKSGIRYLLGKLKDIFVQVKDAVKTVNGNGPDSSGDITLTTVQLAQNLQSDSTQLNNADFLVRASGGEASVGDGNATLTRLYGRIVHEGFVPESLNMTVNAMVRETPITATINRNTFVAYVVQSGTIVLNYSTAWSADPALYGITVTGTPVAGDSITVVYVKEERGVITASNPQTLTATGWNLYNHSVGYARVVKYSDTYGYGITGAYSSIKYSPTLSGSQSAITVTDGKFNVPADGYIWVTGGNNTNTAIWMTWTDWPDEPNSGVWEGYTESTVDFSDIMSELFPYGLLSTGSVHDEINFGTGIAYSRVERLEYTAENRATAEASGRTYDFDENYIYLERATPVQTAISLLTIYTVDDHGIEVLDSNIAVGVQIMYGNNLKNKLERDTLTISAQSLTEQQKQQVYNNLGLSQFQYGVATATSNGLMSATDKSAFDSKVVMGKVVTESNIDNIKASGLYWLNPSIQTSGWPAGENTYGFLKTFARDSGAIVQELFMYSGTITPRLYTRMFMNSQWYPWFRVNTETAWSLDLGTQITANANLNNYKTPGNYASPGNITSTLTNAPPVSSGAFILRVMAGHFANTYVQMAIDVSGVAMFLRYFNQSTWGSWYKYTGTAV